MKEAINSKAVKIKAFLPREKYHPDKKGIYTCAVCGRLAHWRNPFGKDPHFYHKLHNPECRLSVSDEKARKAYSEVEEVLSNINYKRRWNSFLKNILKNYASLNAFRGDEFMRNPICHFFQSKYIDDLSSAEVYRLFAVLLSLKYKRDMGNCLKTVRKHPKFSIGNMVNAFERFSNENGRYILVNFLRYSKNDGIKQLIERFIKTNGVKEGLEKFLFLVDVEVLPFKELNQIYLVLLSLPYDSQIKESALLLEGHEKFQHKQIVNMLLFYKGGNGKAAITNYIIYNDNDVFKNLLRLLRVRYKKKSELENVYTMIDVTKLNSQQKMIYELMK